MIPTNFEWLLRLFLSGACGGIVGYERTRHQKSAGIRTHMVVAIASCLIMIVSKYGFYDVVKIENVSLDPSRIAAQIVSGISFIGAGTILVKKDQISGLTTAAGVWATAAIGMTEGAGLYLIGIYTTFLLIVIQFVFHDDSLLDKLFMNFRIHLQIVVINKKDIIEQLRKELYNFSAKNIRLKVILSNDEKVVIKTDFVIKNRNDKNKLLLGLQKNNLILQISSFANE